MVEISKSLNLMDNAGLMVLILVCSMGFTAFTKVATPLENKYLPFVLMIFGIISSHSYWVRAFCLSKNN